MKLLNDTFDASINHLPYDGTVNYYGALLDENIANQFFDSLIKNIDWRNDEAIIFGKKITTKRKVGWYGDQSFQYTYSKTTKSALKWTNELLQLKKLVEEKTGESFNSCLLNLYHNGNEGMSWHSDGEKELLKNGAIASLSLGAERKFSFKHKNTKKIVSFQLENGSLLVMKDETQQNWLHQLPIMKKVITPRINLTFRTIKYNS